MQQLLKHIFPRRVPILFAMVVYTGCPTASTLTPCNTDQDCVNGKTCINGVCRLPRTHDSGSTSDTGAADGKSFQDRWLPEDTAHISDRKSPDGPQSDGQIQDVQPADRIISDRRISDQPHPDTHRNDSEQPDTLHPDGWAPLGDRIRPDTNLPDNQLPDLSAPDIHVADTSPRDLSSPVDSNQDDAPIEVTEIWGDVQDSDHPETLLDTYININRSTNATSEYLHLYTWPEAQIANAILLKWDLSAIPDSATINAAQLYLFQHTGEGAQYTTTIHRLIHFDPVIPMADGFTFDGTQNWTANACCYYDAPLAQADKAPAEETAVLGLNSGYKTWSAKTMVQYWVDNPAENFGMMVNSDPAAPANHHRYFYSNDRTVVEQRPYLVITYTHKPFGR